MCSSRKSYLGDAVYADFDGWCVVLTTEDGIRVLNKIYLEPEVLQALNAYVERLSKETMNGRTVTPIDTADGSGQIADE